MKRDAGEKTSKKRKNKNNKRQPYENKVRQGNNSSVEARDE